MLTLLSNGYGYNCRYNWFVMGLIENVLDVMTKKGRFVHYKLQPEVLHLLEDAAPLACENGDSALCLPMELQQVLLKVD